MSGRPHFVGIGAVKAGTTWLHHNLDRHADVWMPPIKELRYLDEPRIDLARRFLDPFLPASLASDDRRRYQHWRRQLTDFLRTPSRWLGPRRLAWHLAYFFGPRGPRGYRRLFRAAGDRVCGEISPLYALLGDEEVDRVRRSFPQLAVVYLLRDPIDRTWSHVLLRCLGLAGWRWERVTPELVERTFFARDVHDERFWRNNDYHRVLERWEQRFDRVGVFFHDELVTRPAATLASVCRFLGVSPEVDRGAAARPRHRTPRKLPLPRNIEAEIARRTRPELTRLAARFEGRHPAPGRWLARCQAAGELTTEAHPAGSARW